jgi:hypothetical protein
MLTSWDTMGGQMDPTLTLVVTFVVAGAGAYLGSYLKKKGENLATHEDVDKLVDQMTAVTQATKQIESAISDEVWDRQRRWELRRDIAIDLIRSMGAAENALSMMELNFRGVKYNPLNKEQEASVNFWNKALLRFLEADSVARLVCGEEVVGALRDSHKTMMQIASDITKGKALPPDWYKELTAGTQRIRVALRLELEKANDSVQPSIH